MDTLSTLPRFGTAAILAGGKSSRMGFDKQLLTENNRRIMEQLIETLKEEFSDVIVVTARPELYEGMGVRLFQDIYKDRGPLAGLHVALENSQSQYLYLLACDMPVVCLNFIRHMKQCLLDSGSDVCACQRDHQLEPFNTFYSKNLIPAIIDRLENGNRSLFRFIHTCNTLMVPEQVAAQFDKDFQMFTNINTRPEYEAYLGNPQSKLPDYDSTLAGEKEIIRYIGGKYVKLQDLMVHEASLQLKISGVTTRTLFCSPSELKELVIGHLYTQGYIRTMDDILSLELDETTFQCRVELASAIAEPLNHPLQDTCCFDPEILLSNQQHFYDHSTLQKATAGTHCCALCDDHGTHLSCIDISRHNCMDKIAGKAMLSGISLTDKYIITSGRIPMDMILKVAAIGVPMIVSRSTPTIAAVEKARSLNITLLGFSRENRFNIYSAPHRLEGCCK